MFYIVFEGLVYCYNCFFTKLTIKYFVHYYKYCKHLQYVGVRAAVGVWLESQLYCQCGNILLCSNIKLLHTIVCSKY